jgi:uncharacterized protein (DUF885 family)
MRKTLIAAGALPFLALAAFLPATALAQPADAIKAGPMAETPSAKLTQLFIASDEANLKRNPLQALFRGDTRYADQFGDYVTDAYLEAQKAAIEADLRALAAIDRAALSPDEQISYDVFKWQRESSLKGYAPEIVGTTKLLPIDHFRGLHQFVPDIFSGQSVAQFRTVKDYEDNLKRLDGFVVTLDRSLERMKQGVGAGAVQPRLVSERVLAQLDRHVAGGVDSMPLMMPVRKFPEGISPADQARLTAEYTAMVQDKVLPSYARMRNYVRDAYLPASRGNERPGLVSMPGGPDLYRYLVGTQTTTAMTPDEIHDLGLSEVARIQGEMRKVMKEVGFKSGKDGGDLSAFFTHLKTDPKFKPASREALTEGYYAIGKRVDATLPRLFRTIPKTPLEIRPYPPFLEKDSAGGSYQPGTPDGSRPGVFYYNTYDLPARTTPGDGNALPARRRARAPFPDQPGD